MPSELPSPGDDRTLVASFLAGDEDTVSRVRSWVRAQVGRQLGVGSARRTAGLEADDIEQEVLLDLLEALEEGRFKGESRFETYVRSFSRFKCIDRLRARGRWSFTAVEEIDVQDERPSALERLGRSEDVALARQVVESLSPRCRELWAMVLEGKSYAEMSRQLGVSEGALRVQVHRCRQSALTLRESLSAKDRV